VTGSGPPPGRGRVFNRPRVPAAMPTLGRVVDPAVHDFYDALRSYDAARAAKNLAEDADFESPWHGKLHGRAAIESALKAWLGDAKTRPSLSISDVSGERAITHLKLSVSGRFGKAPEPVRMSVLCLQHVIHQVSIQRL
jgi:ketosteroid isomerase-like protein